MQAEIRILEYRLSKTEQESKLKFKNQLVERTSTHRQNLEILLADTSMDAEKKARKIEINVRNLLAVLKRLEN